MASANSVTRWLGQLEAGDHEAAAKLWERYFERLAGLARQKLSGSPRRAADEEDVALSAFASFCRGLGRGRFPRLRDRDGLWRLLVVITARKALDRVLHERCLSRGGGRVQGESALEGPGAGLDGLAGREPTPDFVAQVNEELERLLEGLGEPELRLVARWKLEGYDNAEIAERLGCALRTVERKLGRIRGLWREEVGP
jgi:DNA-directed RNA polymerase specialized sigma24 family protein